MFALLFDKVGKAARKASPRIVDFVNGQLGIAGNPDIVLSITVMDVRRARTASGKTQSLAARLVLDWGDAEQQEWLTRVSRVAAYMRATKGSELFQSPSLGYRTVSTANNIVSIGCTWSGRVSFIDERFVVTILQLVLDEL